MAEMLRSGIERGRRRAAADVRDVDVAKLNRLPGGRGVDDDARSDERVVAANRERVLALTDAADDEDALGV